ncbi:hypothetical protein [Acetobacter papayae]|uniref:hypothetical protein n=1 Tax=Acetobacter papayae TaxID=1076592 RepID=UPI0039ED7EF9
MISDGKPMGVVKRIVQGMLLLSSGRREGLACFEGTTNALGAAMAPQLAFVLVGGLQVFLQPDTVMELVKLLLSFCVLLMPLVISHAYARRWGREGLWLRYMTAATWCNWMIVLVSLVCTVLAVLLFPALVKEPSFMVALVFVATVYEMWLQWFVARVGLELGAGRAIVLYLSVLLACFVLYALAALLPPHYLFMHDLFQPMVGGNTQS